jgi:hypothetical protein
MSVLITLSRKIEVEIGTQVTYSWITATDEAAVFPGRERVSYKAAFDLLL